jgi:hypothetical protein
LLFNLLSSNCYFHLEEGIDGSVVTDITAEDLSEMGLTLKLGTRKKLLSFLQNLRKSSTPTQDGPAATTPSKVYVPASTASTGVYESAATPTAEANIQLVTSASTGVYESAATPTAEANIQLVTSASTGVYESAATPTADEASNIQQLVTSASTGVYESAASTQTEAHIHNKSLSIMSIEDIMSVSPVCCRLMIV